MEISKIEKEEPNNQAIEIEWYYLKSISGIIDKKLTDSEIYLENAVESNNTEYVRIKDLETLTYLKQYLPHTLGFIASLLSATTLFLHYTEVDKYYLQQTLKQKQQQQPLLQSSITNQNNLFPAKNTPSTTIPFKQISKFQQRIRIFAVMGLCYLGGYINGYANYKYNLIRMNDIYYQSLYQQIVSSLSKSKTTNQIV